MIYPILIFICVIFGVPAIVSVILYLICVFEVKKEKDKDFAEIESLREEDGELCYRFHYTDKEVNERHAKFMKDRGWVDTGYVKFNSGNGTLHIYKKKV